MRTACPSRESTSWGNGGPYLCVYCMENGVGKHPQSPSIFCPLLDPERRRVVASNRQRKSVESHEVKTFHHRVLFNELSEPTSVHNMMTIALPTAGARIYRELFPGKTQRIATRRRVQRILSIVRRYFHSFDAKNYE